MKKALGILTAACLMVGLTVLPAGAAGKIVNLDPDKVEILSSGGDRTFTPRVQKDVGTAFVVSVTRGEGPTEPGENNEKIRFLRLENPQIPDGRNPLPRNQYC